MKFELTILGCSSAVPVYNRYMSSQVLNVKGEFILIDCGEGTQFRLNEFKISKNKISTILISHLHGDHLFGLPGLINSMSMSGRKKSLNIFGPVGVDRYLNSIFEVSQSYVDFKLNIHIVDHKKVSEIIKSNNFVIKSFPLTHRGPTVGYKVEEYNKFRNIEVSAISKYNLDYNQIKEAKLGSDITLDNGIVLKNEELTLTPAKNRSYAYCSDTKYDESIINSIKGVDILYHESTYMKDLQSSANDRFHSTTIDAANIAKQAKVKLLVLGHYSSRYKHLEPLLNEAKSIFEFTELGIGGKVFKVNKD